jgi:hypothetical protein
MREKRTVVWERKPRVPASPAAERIRARLRPSAFTRLTDRAFERCDALVEAADRIEERLASRETSRPRRMLYGYFAALVSGLVLRGAESAIAGPSAPVPSVLAIAIASLIGAAVLFRGRSKRNPRDEPPRILLGWFLLLIVIFGTWLMTSSLSGGAVLRIGR